MTARKKSNPAPQLDADRPAELSLPWFWPGIARWLVAQS